MTHSDLFSNWTRHRGQNRRQLSLYCVVTATVRGRDAGLVGIDCYGPKGEFERGEWELGGLVMDNRASVRRSRVHVKKTTPSCWAEETQNRRSFGGHKRSASWGSAEHLKEVAKLRQQLQKRSRHAAPSAAGYEPSHHALTTGVTQTSPLVPLSRLASRLRRSVEGLNLELEEVFVSENRDDQHEHLDIPDGHRAPAPVQRCSSGSQSESSPGPLDLSLLSPSQSPCPLDPSLLSPSTSPCPLNPLLFSPTQSPESATREVLCPSPSTFFPSYGVDPPVLPPCSTSSFSSPPCLDQSLFFKRQPPEGSEPLPMCQDTMLACPNELLNLQPSCPDLNKVNFTPHGGSAFCPVSLLKPLLPSMDLLFRGLSVSPVTGCPEQVSPTRQLGMQ
ncbi:protein FAM117A isoform X2 [Corythoichthys intestinalis]|uniref:protein FAM117A isoform X2 n=1 Tax=Corythoichthys intestinalis TaxID=161448 RepID=UPI0025A5BAC0|nr:protein FAM117A isoform X2 [Corythoichthys intestinalis]